MKYNEIEEYRYVTEDGLFNVIDLRGNHNEESLDSSSDESHNYLKQYKVDRLEPSHHEINFERLSSQSEFDESNDSDSNSLRFQESN